MQYILLQCRGKNQVLVLTKSQVSFIAQVIRAQAGLRDVFGGASNFFFVFCEPPILASTLPQQHQEFRLKENQVLKSCFEDKTSLQLPLFSCHFLRTLPQPISQSGYSKLHTIQEEGLSQNKKRAYFKVNNLKLQPALLQHSAMQRLVLFNIHSQAVN